MDSASLMGAARLFGVRSKYWLLKSSMIGLIWEVLVVLDLSKEASVVAGEFEASFAVEEKP